MEDIKIGNINEFPYDGYIAQLHCDSVLSKEEAEEWRKIGDMGILNNLDNIKDFNMDLFIGKSHKIPHINDNIK